MTLVLSVLRCPDAAPPETRRLEGGEFRIGRGPDNDWVLTDPERVLSKRHCVIAWRGGAWQLADTSTNGTFVNRDAAPLGAGAVHTLADGDRIRLGTYEIEVRLDVRQSHAAPSPGLGPQRSVFDDPFGDDPFAAPEAPAAPTQPDSWFGGAGSVALPHDFDPLAPGDSLFGAKPVADHSPAHSDAFRPPPMAPKLLPDDWDLDVRPAAEPQGVRPAEPQGVRPAEPQNVRSAEPLPVPPAQPIPPPVRPVPEAPPTPSVSRDADLLAVFLDAAGMGNARTGDSAEVMRRLGAAFRATVAGLRQAMIARAAVKGEFRIEQTMIRARGNNPLKFSADDDDAMAALLGLGRRTDIAADAAIADALRDIRLHEIATMGAMQAAVRALLDRLDPASLRAEAEQGRAMLPAQRRARAFDAFEALHGEISRALADDFDSVFGKAFARAYERALAEAEAREP
ncbi:type VI secretion system-associated FHA domain protein TagH [Acidiphilium sp. AL]|uniref:Type VI secretion system-associated FHA domain protein TagH n=1 Tax=Acidiphilium iwatense TaxID=768198 RepID=A0ABS9E2C7_9PROT|nr:MULTISPECIES: type VI secretion system-associated FHA domain protein TagH [Acidiphilium]MCF3948498.1 type VI secretion system-associated FHA domain protein TagH [Acidiphilium iwatense]MCU4161235.1 type VI secretion system-associated FHA domain protein TagH [Acidiphilium sp. AL]